MATFIGTEKEFSTLIGPRMRNKVQSLTKDAKRATGNVCQHCGKKMPELDAAHVHGRERKEIIHSVLEKYRDGDTYSVDLQRFEQEFVDAHYPIEKTFLFLCKECHSKYDAPVRHATSVVPKLQSTSRSGFSRTKNGTETLPISTVPSDKNEFARLFIETGCAIIKTIYNNGDQHEQEWHRREFSDTSGLINNLRTRAQFRQGKWQAAGISEVFVYIPSAIRS